MERSKKRLDKLIQFIRNSMSEEKFLNILNRQISNEEKCAKADYIINNLEIEATKKQVANIYNIILENIK